MDTYTAAAAEYKVTHTTIIRWAKNNRDGWKSVPK
jgi:intein-encoded DNA endonuclease-like protein